PALDHNFLVSVKLDRVAALSVQITEETVLPSAEREIRHGRGDPNVDTDISCGGFVSEAAGRRAARSEQRRLVAIGTAFEERNRGIDAIDVYQAEHRAKNFRVGEVAGCGDVVEN